MHLTKFKNLPKYESAKDVPMATKEQGLDLYKASIDAGMTFWQYLEMVQPSKPTDNLTAFERQLQLNGVIVKSRPDLGLYSSPGEYFFQSDRPGSAILFPVLLQKTALWTKLKAFVDINRIVATTRTISGTTAYTALSIDDTAISNSNGQGTASAHGRRFRVDQRGNFPAVNIGWSEKTNAVTKHGVQLNWTYEFVRRASIELMQTVVARIMIQDQLELFNEAVSVIINGDGTANPACTVKTFKQTAAGATSNQIVEPGITAAGTLSYAGWLKFIGNSRPYTYDAVFGNLDTLVKFVTMSRPTMDPAEIITNLLEAKNQGTAKLDTPLFPNVTLFLADGMPADNLLAVDTSFALERVIELGSDLKEVERVIQNQTEAMVISISDNVSKIFNEAAQVLDFSGIPAA
jgi:hypothetical protein